MGFIGGLAGAMTLAAVVHEAYWKHLVADSYTTLESAKYYDLQTDMRTIEMAERGEAGKIVALYCVLRDSRLKYVRPDTIRSPEVRQDVEQRLDEAMLLVSRLQKEDKCATRVKPDCCDHGGIGTGTS